MGKMLTKLLLLLATGVIFVLAVSPRSYTSESFDRGMESAAQTQQEQSAEMPPSSDSPEQELPESSSGATETLLPQVDLDSWELMLVNADNPLPEDYAPTEIAYVGDSQCPQDSRIAQALEDFAQGARDQGLPVYLSSGYRTYSEQQGLFRNMVNREGSEEAAAKIVSRPGTSEHQTGLACDITDIYRELKTHDLENTETYRWMKEHCHEYGFIVRYPEDKSDITGVIYEPWHFRYVGMEAAEYIMKNGLCLEEFLALYQ